QLPHIADYSDDCRPRPVGMSYIGSHPYTLADWIAIVKSPFRQRLADHNAYRKRRTVAFVEKSAPTQRDSHGLEISWAYGITETGLLLMGKGFELHTIECVITAQRYLIYECRRFHSGNIAYRLERPLE